MSTNEPGGFEIGAGIVIGPLFFQNRKTTMFSPPIWVFKFGMNKIINHLKNYENKKSDSAEFQYLFNSTLDSFVSEVLIYIETRLKLMSIKNKLKKFKMNSVPDAIKAYKKFLQIDLNTLVDLKIIKALDIKRGKKHHTNDRYNPDYSILEIAYGSAYALIILAKKIQQTIEIIDTELDKIKLVYKIVNKEKDGKILVEWTSIDHAFDMVNEKIIERREGVIGLDKKHVTYFAIGATLKSK